MEAESSFSTQQNVQKETFSDPQPQETVEDFIRNFLYFKGLLKTLEIFQDEYYQMMSEGKLNPESQTVPDIYVQNNNLELQVKEMEQMVEEYKNFSLKSKTTIEKLKKERDHYKMHHTRVSQEKSKLVEDIKKYKKQISDMESIQKQLSNRYETALKEKSLAFIDRDQLNSKVSTLEDALKNLNMDNTKAKSPSRKKPQSDHLFPKLNEKQKPESCKPDKYKMIYMIEGHSAPVSSLKFHPKKMILASTSDDQTWKLWSFPNGDLLSSHQIHNDWISDCDFNPDGTLIATASGDHSVKIWDFKANTTLSALKEHTQAVWSVNYHHTNNWLLSCSMDQTIKLWDSEKSKTIKTFRGHADSVNYGLFVPNADGIVTCSGDKTISLWDPRSGYCVQTLFGHGTAVNHITMPAQGTPLAVSADADGIIKIWDFRKIAEVDSVDYGPQSITKIALDSSGQILSAASLDGDIKFYDLSKQKKISQFSAHSSGAQTVIFDMSGDNLVTAGNNGLIKIFSNK